MSRKAMMRLLYIILALMVVPTSMSAPGPVTQQRSSATAFAVQQQAPIFAGAQHLPQNSTQEQPLTGDDPSSSTRPAGAPANANQRDPEEEVYDAAGDSEDDDSCPPDFDAVLCQLMNRDGDQTDPILICHVRQTLGEAAGPATPAQLKQIKMAIQRSRALLARDGRGCAVLPIGLSMVSSFAPVWVMLALQPCFHGRTFLHAVRC